MHDASEAFVGDVSRPLKALLPEYKVIEARIERAICERFAIKYPLDLSIKHVDNRFLVTEQRQLMRNRDEWSDVLGVEPIAIELPCWAPAVAKERFLSRYEELAHQSFS